MEGKQGERREDRPSGDTPSTAGGIFEAMRRHGHEQVIFNYDRATGLRAIIAIHDTTLGPALGGCRMWPYPSEADAVEDALRLSEGMTYKAAAAGLDHGGGKAVIIGNPATDKSEALFRALGRFLETLHGRFVTGEDMGTEGNDFVHAARETRYLVGLPEAYGGSGDTGEMTALGVVQAMRAAMVHRRGQDSLAGQRVLVQGLGKVGRRVVAHLARAGAHVLVADIDPQAVGTVTATYPVEPIDPWSVLDTPCDIYAPCAFGNVINPETVDRLRCQVIAGSANNQLADESMGDRLYARGILYAPDFITNAGGLLQVADELRGYHPERVQHRVEGIFDFLLTLFRQSEERGIATNRLALTLVQERLALYHDIHRIFTGRSD
jgi:glutamate dehydrogenase/leucine dehydrogenase